MQLSTLLFSSLLLAEGLAEGLARPSPARHVNTLQRSHHDKAKRQVEAQRFGNGRNRFGRPNFGGNFGNNNNNGGGAGASSSVADPAASASIDPVAPAPSDAAGDTAGQNGGNGGAAGGDTGGGGGDGAATGGDTGAGNGGQADNGAGGDVNGGGGTADGNGANGGDQAAGGNGNGGGDQAAGGNGGGDAAAGENGGDGAAGENGGNANGGNGGNANGGNGGNANGGNGNGNGNGNGGNGGENGNGNAGNADDQADDKEVANDAGANAQQPGPAVPVLVSNGGQTLNQDLIMNTQANPNATAGQAASATSNDNFIDFCQGQTLTNGLQVKEGSCAVTPIGQIPSTQNMVSTMFVVPANGDTLPADQTFTMQLAVQGMVMGSFTNAQLNYYSAPQQIDGSGRIVGHAHVVIQEMTSTTSTQVLNPQQFAFFKGLNFQDVNRVSSLAVDGGLPRGAYRICTIMSASNHQSVVMPVAQRGAENTCSYFNTN